MLRNEYANNNKTNTQCHDLACLDFHSSKLYQKSKENIMSTYSTGYYKTLVGSTWGLEVSWVLLGLPPMLQIQYYR